MWVTWKNAKYSIFDLHDPLRIIRLWFYSTKRWHPIDGATPIPQGECEGVEDAPLSDSP